MRKRTTTAMLVVALAGLGAVGAGTVSAKQGADDPAGHVRGGQGADDRGTDDRRVSSTAHRGRGRDDKRGDDRRARGRGRDDRPGDDRGRGRDG